MKSICFALLTLFIISDSWSQDNDSQRINEIRKRFKVINDCDDYYEIDLENEQFMEHVTDGGGTLTGFYISEQVSKIITRIGLSNGTVKTEYYFWKDELFFIYEEQERWYYDVENDIMDYDSVELKVERRFYLRADTVFHVKMFENDPYVQDDFQYGNKLVQLGKSCLNSLEGKGKN